MVYILRIKRQREKNEESYWQTIEYVCENEETETVATVLRAIENGKVMRDAEGNTLTPIAWECSCLQKKCGSCAMLIDGRPNLACSYFLKNHKGKQPIVIEPLTKFPVVRDLIVDRSIMRQNLKNIQAWMTDKAAATDEKNVEIMYEASRCLQCGCCLEVCPNFCGGGDFFGAAAAVPVSRIVNAADRKSQKEMKNNYNKYVYNGCGKSLACQNICPEKINVDKLLSRTNARTRWI
jgi:succinate dehydrogenase / fumarate reductase iron-sulfur subunit